MRWITSLSCSIATLQSSDSSSFVSTILQWLEFIFLAPCLLRIRFMAIDLIFLLSLLAPWLKTFLVSAPTSPLEEPLIRPRTHSVTTIWYKATVSVTALLAVGYAALSLLALSRGVGSEWNGVDLLSCLFQAMTNAVILFMIMEIRAVGAPSHPSPVRVYWSSSFFLVCLSSATALVRLMLSDDQDMEVDDIFFLATFPFNTFLFVVSINGSTGITSTSVDEDVEDVDA